MYELKQIGKVFTSKFVGTGPSSYEKCIYRAAVSQKFRNADLASTIVCAVYTVHTITTLFILYLLDLQNVHFLDLYCITRIIH